MATTATKSILAISAEDYHADPAPVPSLSATIASILCSQSPAHAWVAHPKLNPDYQPVDKPSFDLGRIVHQLLLEGHTDDLVVINAANFRTKAAQEERDAAYAAGKSPILFGDVSRVQAMVDAIGERLSNHQADPPLFTDGKSEQTLMWEEPGGVICRARCDWLRDDLATIDDLKTTGKSAHPDKYRNALYSVGGDVQAAMNIRGLEKITGKTPEFRWVVVETDPPYALSVIAPGPDVLTIGRKKVDFAIDLWRRCLKTNLWPAYPNRVCYVDLPGWEETAWLEKEEREAT